MNKRWPSIAPILEEAVGVPEVELAFFYEYHDYGQTPHEKLSRFEKMFNQSDVFVTEAGPWNQELLDQTRNFKFEARQGPPERASHVIFSADKPIYFIDPQETDPIWQEQEDIYNKNKIDYSMTWEELLQARRKLLHRELDVYRKKEEVWEK